jgi:hypothetical protein
VTSERWTGARHLKVGGAGEPQKKSSQSITAPKQKKPKTLLDWVAPSMVLDGLIIRSPWMDDACAEAISLFADPKLHLAATVMVALHPFALDPIKQAPAVVVAAAWRANLSSRKGRLRVARTFILACKNGSRLNELMMGYGLAPQLRALSGLALKHDQFGILKRLSGIPASTLAQVIPKSVEEQRQWLELMACWTAYVDERKRDTLLAWAAANLRGEEARQNVTEVADFARTHRAGFNLRWSLAQAKAASHADFGHRPFSFADRNADWTQVIDYAPLPSHARIGGFDFYALQTPQQLYDEGKTLHRCVGVYTDRVMGGMSRIYSVRQSGQRIATLELLQSYPSACTPRKFEVSQLKGPCNTRPSVAGQLVLLPLMPSKTTEGGNLKEVPVQSGLTQTTSFTELRKLGRRERRLPAPPPSSSVLLLDGRRRRGRGWARAGPQRSGK